MREIVPNMANTPLEMDQLVQNALGRITIFRMEAWFVPVAPTPLERFINDVAEGML